MTSLRALRTYYLPADTALEAYADLLVELSGTIDADDFEALIAIGTVLMRHAGTDSSDTGTVQRLKLAPRSRR